MYHLSLTARWSLGTGITPDVTCTSATRIVPLSIGVERKCHQYATFVISRSTTDNDYFSSFSPDLPIETKMRNKTAQKLHVSIRTKARNRKKEGEKKVIDDKTSTTHVQPDSKRACFRKVNQWTRRVAISTNHKCQSVHSCQTVWEALTWHMQDFKMSAAVLQWISWEREIYSNPTWTSKPLAKNQQLIWSKELSRFVHVRYVVFIMPFKCTPADSLSSEG